MENMIVVGIWIIVLSYFLPTFIALVRNSSKKMGIFIVNFLTGWTFIGWLIALVWSFTSESTNDKNLRLSSYQSKGNYQSKEIDGNSKVKELDENILKSFVKYLRSLKLKDHAAILFILIISALGYLLSLIF